MGYIYVTGYTEFKNGQTCIDEMKYNAFNQDTFFLVVVKPILENLGCYNEGIVLNAGVVPLVNGYYLECNSDMTRITINRELTNRGYIYNTKKRSILYSCFVHKMDNEGNGLRPRKEEEDLSDIEEIFTEPINIPAVKSAPSRICFVEELKVKLEARKMAKQQTIDIMPKIEEMSEFQEELIDEIKLRRNRSVRREQKIMLKRKRRQLKG
jgi:hypothetical protein